MATRGPRPKRKNFGEEFGERLKSARERRGFTQEQLAEAVGMHAGRISDYESGRIVPQLEKAARMAGVLEITLDELVGGVTPEVTDDVRDPRLRASVRALEATANPRLIDAAGTTVEAFVALAGHEEFESSRTKRR